jgi:dipeptidase
MLAAGKAATADGSVMVARSCDALGDYAHQVRIAPRKEHFPGEVLRASSSSHGARFERAGDIEVPQVSETYGYVSIMAVLENEVISESMGGINEFQVCAGASSGGAINKRAQEVCPVMPTSLGDYRPTLVLERCETAREGVRLLGQLTEKYGARTDNYVVADPAEAWLYEEYRSRLWVAARVPDDCFVVEANSCRIGEVDLNDTKNFMGARNLVSFAIENGLYDPKRDAPFNAARVYSAQTGKTRHGIGIPEYDRRRIWRGISLLAPSTSLDPEELSWTYPLFIKPDQKLSPRHFLSLFTDHYEGTKYDHYGMTRHKYKPTTPRGGQSRRDVDSIDLGKLVAESRFHLNENLEYQLAPVWGLERIIGTAAAVNTWCAQLRSWMPNPIGGLLWTGLAEGATSPHIPFYSGITKIPDAYTIGEQKARPDIEPLSGSIYDERSAYWIFRVVSNLVNLFYTATSEEVIPVWRQWQEKLYSLQPMVEKTAVEIYGRNPDLSIEYVTEYSFEKAREALDTATAMTRRLHTIIAHYCAPL